MIRLMIAGAAGKMGLEIARFKKSSLCRKGII